jgi:hypothetical protein
MGSCEYTHKHQIGPTFRVSARVFFSHLTSVDLITPRNPKQFANQSEIYSVKAQLLSSGVLLGKSLVLSLESHRLASGTISKEYGLSRQISHHAGPANGRISLS